jgi:hypothetical protein
VIARRIAGGLSTTALDDGLCPPLGPRSGGREKLRHGHRWLSLPADHNCARLRRIPLILILIILLLVFGGGGYYMGPGLGYYGGGGVSLVLLIVILFLLFGGRRSRL